MGYLNISYMLLLKGKVYVEMIVICLVLDYYFLVIGSVIEFYDFR